jgi:hypothetical protein
MSSFKNQSEYSLSLFYLKFAVHLLSFLFHVIWWTLYQEIIEYSLCLEIIVAVGFLIYFLPLILFKILVQIYKSIK